MLSSLRKKTDAAPPAVPAWHPNFRNYERLPDTKVVRTAFFINGLAALIAIAVLLLFAFQEFKRATLSEQIADWESQIASTRAASSAAVAAFRKFQGEEKKVQEVTRFLDRKVVVSDFLLRVGETLPPEITLDHFDFRPTGITLRGAVRGTPGEASGTASAYVAQLQEDPAIGPKFESIVLTSLGRNSTTGQLNLEISLRLAATK